MPSSPETMPKDRNIVRPHVRYEMMYSKWSGPISKATKALSGVQISPINHIAFLEFMEKEHNPIYRETSFVRFYQYPNHSQSSKCVPEYRIAVFYIRPNPSIRDSLYELREEITLLTGWYPLVMGEKSWGGVNSKQLERHSTNTLPYLKSLHVGKIIKVSMCGPLENGNSFLLQGDQGSLLLDAGMNVNASLPPDLRGIFLSHFHQDHVGGLELMDIGQTSVILSSSTLEYLRVKNSANLPYQKRIFSNALVIERLPEKILIQQSIEIMPIFHAPGSYGISIHDDHRWFFYPGDICLRNGFYNPSMELIRYIKKADAEQKWVLLDATMVNRDQVEISNDDNPKSIIQEMVQELEKRNVIFCSKSVETLIYQYILTFVHTRTTGDQKAIKLFVSSDLLCLAQSLFIPVEFRKAHQIDPFIHSVIHDNVTNFVESHRVYPLESLNFLHPDEKVIIFATVSDIESNELLQKRIFGSNVILAGTIAIRPEDEPLAIRQAKPRTTLRVSSPDWSFHTHEDDLSVFIRELSKDGVHCLLFHNYPKRLEKFIKKYSLDPSLVSVITQDGIAFGDS